MTIIENILEHKTRINLVSSGDTVVINIGMTVLIDLQFATM
ncbi:hypothetical protein [Mycobacterium uberis]|nr:hypothetical protein [Mycobacterium uberis]